MKVKSITEDLSLFFSPHTLNFQKALQNRMFALSIQEALLTRSQKFWYPRKAENHTQMFNVFESSPSLSDVLSVDLKQFYVSFLR